VEDCLLLGHQEDVSKKHKMMNRYFQCDNTGELKGYVGCKIKNREGDKQISIVQSVIIRSFINEYAIEENPRIEVPASSSDSFSPVMDRDEQNEVDQKCYQSGTGKLLHLSKWSHPDIFNITKELSRHFMKANQAYLKVMKKVVTSCVNTEKHGIIINPTGNRNGKFDQEYFLNHRSIRFQLCKQYCDPRKYKWSCFSNRLIDFCKERNARMSHSFCRRSRFNGIDCVCTRDGSCKTVN
jgi:hypothetical protein